MTGHLIWITVTYEQRQGDSRKGVYGQKFGPNLNEKGPSLL